MLAVGSLFEENDLGAVTPGISPVLRKTNVTTITNAKCTQVYNIIFESQLCVSTIDGHGSCNVIASSWISLSLYGGHQFCSSGLYGATLTNYEKKVFCRDTVT